MKRVTPNKLGRTAQSAIMSPLTAGLVALRLGRADAEHYHDLAGGMSIAYRAAELVPRHRHLLAELQPALDALNAIFARHQQRTVEDAPWSGTVEEVDQVENGMRIYEGLIRTTPGPVMLRAIARVRLDAAEAANVPD
ncbi:hypothetical protein [Bordetella phage vB_BbrM_PHB04]|uniref:Uncharacterized protein n=1 Tax=Bordetella phage vB_BbrM_PHB04 TaxID=2029657 RepID=A0A291LAM2_9CAUD|nr:hypothetical protein HOS14_gp040 [Bordetella phage vB_BbrM_PHB04]ATI15658.1 hypothetical protein [Bordetella phage vB_BbrM_PHB04]